MQKGTNQSFCKILLNSSSENTVKNKYRNDGKSILQVYKFCLIRYLFPIIQLEKHEKRL